MTKPLEPVYAALDECGIAWVDADWAPAKPPQPPYAVVLDRVDAMGADERVMALRHTVTVVLHEGAGMRARRDLEWALAKRDLFFEAEPPEYDYDLKLFEEGFYEIEFIEKRSDENDHRQAQAGKGNHGRLVPGVHPGI